MESATPRSTPLTAVSGAEASERADTAVHIGQCEMVLAPPTRHRVHQMDQPWGFLAGVGLWAALGALVVGAEVFRAKSRRRFVEAFVASRGWQLKSCRYRFELVKPGLCSYNVVVIDQTGHVLEGGVARATGFLRRKAWIDW